MGVPGITEPANGGAIKSHAAHTNNQGWFFSMQMNVGDFDEGRPI